MRSGFGTILIAAGALAISGCSKEGNNFRSFYAEAGSDIEGRDFGNATMQNTLVQTGERDFAIDLTRRFAADVPNTVNFAFDSAVLDGEAQANLLKQADWIRQFPEVRFRVFGHTDLVGSDAYNKRLGLRRAQAAVNFLASQGISKSRLEAVVSYGETQPLVFVQTEERKNRRTVTEVSGFVKNHPALLNGKYAAVIFREYINTGALPQHSVENTAQSQGGSVVSGGGG